MIKMIIEQCNYLSDSEQLVVKRNEYRFKFEGVVYTTG